jgi:phosphinothricin acetyltransferase
MTAIREAAGRDLPAMTEIYNHYILNSQATFDTEPFAPDQRKSWFDNYAGNSSHVLLVLEDEGRVSGFAGAGPYRREAAFDRTVETSIYLAPGAIGRGFGRALYQGLFLRLEKTDLHRALAGIALPNEASVALHRKLGFEDIGVFSEYAVKWDSYWSSLWMQKML